MGFFSTIKKIFGASDVADGDTNTKVSGEVTEQHVDGKGNARLVPQENASGPESAPIAEKLAADADAMILRLRQAEPRLSAWLAIVLEGVEETGDLLWQRLRFLLQSLQAPEDEASRFLGELKTWLAGLGLED